MKKFGRVRGQRGWFKESERHSQAAKGIPSLSKKPPKTYLLLKTYLEGFHNSDRILNYGAYPNLFVRRGISPSDTYYLLTEEGKKEAMKLIS